MADSRRLRILEALKARVAEISVANGFNTDAGQRLYLGEVPMLGPHDPPQAIAILPREDQPGDVQVGKVNLVLPVDVVALVKPSIDEPWVIVEQVLADIKTAVELEDRSLGGLLSGGKNNPEGLLRGSTETYPRTSGSDVVGALITYACVYRESWGRPEA